MSLDRTEWKLGQKHVINFLVLAIVGEGVAYPICWMILDKPGASNTRERRKLLDRFVRFFGSESIDFLCMDKGIRRPGLVGLVDQAKDRLSFEDQSQ